MGSKEPLAVTELVFGRIDSAMATTRTKGEFAEIFPMSAFRFRFQDPTSQSRYQLFLVDGEKVGRVLFMNFTANGHSKEIHKCKEGKFIRRLLPASGPGRPGRADARAFENENRHGRHIGLEGH